MFHQHRSHLSNLGLITFPLEIDLLKYARFAKHMMAAANPFFEATFDEESAQILKRNVCIGGSPKNLKEKLIVIGHRCEPPLDYRRHNLTNAALQFTVIGDGRAHSHVRSGNWRDAERD